MLILSGSSHPKLAAALTKQLNIPLAERAISAFPDKTIRIRINSSVKNQTVVLVQTLIHPVHNHLIELLLLADAAKSIGATKIIAIIPYLAYTRQNKVFLPGEPLSARVIAQVLSCASIDEILTFDLHHPDIAKFFSVPIHNLSFLPTLIHETILSQHYVVVAPDKGAALRVQAVAKKLSLPVVVIDKHRSLATGKVTINKRSRFSLNFEVFANYLIVDDLIVTGNTLVAAAKFLKSRGAKSITVLATHGLFINGFQKLRRAGINRIFISDSIPHRKLPPWIKTISTIPFLADHLRSLTSDP